MTIIANLVLFVKIEGEFISLCEWIHFSSSNLLISCDSLAEINVHFDLGDGFNIIVHDPFFWSKMTIY